MSIDGYIGGYRLDLERRDELVASAVPFTLPQRAFAAPEEIDPRPYTTIENQGSQGSCQGHALSSCVEHCYHIKTGRTIQLSRQWAYIETQRLDGLLGRDQGSTIDGGRRLAQTVGICREDLWPYPGRYVTTPPDRAACLADAANYRIRSHSMLSSSYADVFGYLSSGVGAVLIGISWGLNPVNGVCETFRPGGGGHAVAILGYSRRKQGDRNYVWLLNSWGPSWGINGWAEIAPSVIDAIAAHRYTVMVGLSDLSVPEPRKLDWGTLA